MCEKLECLTESEKHKPQMTFFDIYFDLFSHRHVGLDGRNICGKFNNKNHSRTLGKHGGGRHLVCGLVFGSFKSLLFHKKFTRGVRNWEEAL